MNDVVPLTLTPDHALRLIRDLAADSGRIVIVPHGKLRQKQRRISRRQVELCVQRGTISEGPFFNPYGNWQVTLYRHAAGEEMSCAVVIEWPSRLLVITVF